MNDDNQLTIMYIIQSLKEHLVQTLEEEFLDIYLESHACSDNVAGMALFSIST